MKAGSEPPLSILAEVTHRCPLRCPYCSNPVELNRRSTEMDTDEWLGVLEEAAEMGVLQVHFSGGEPTARGDLDQMIRRAEDLGLYTNLITAGVLLDREKLQHLADCGLQHLQLSLQGATPETSDRIGGYPGALEKKLEIGRMVGEIGMPLTVNAVMHRQNLDELEQVIDIAVELNAQRLEVAHVQYYGWGFHNRKALLPTRKQLEHSTKVVDAARERLKGVLTFDYVVPDYYARRPKACMGGWGRQFLNVNPAGYILPCHAAESIPGMTFERIGDRPLADIWRNSEPFERFRGTDWMPEPCQSCDRKEQDWGGCRCQAYAVTGDPLVTDPACELSPKHAMMDEIAMSDSDDTVVDFDYRQLGGLPNFDKI